MSNGNPQVTSNDTIRAGGEAHVLTVAAGEPFLDTIAHAILSGDLPHTGGTKPDPLTLPGMTLILPTPRAARAMQDAFLRASPERALLLPRLVSITDSDEDLTLLSALDAQGLLGGDQITELPPAMSDIERHVTLTGLVLHWSRAMSEAASGDPAEYLSDAATYGGQDTPAQAAALAGDLAQLMDAVEREGSSLQGIKDLVPENLSAHWEATLNFLKIITEAWPHHLAEKNLSAKTARRNAAILAEAERLEKTKPDTPVIVAGITGSIPATAELMRVVAQLPQGAIVLPGLDTSLDETSWQIIRPTAENDDPAPHGHPEHPQFGLKALLDTLEVDRKDVVTVGNRQPAPEHQDRKHFISEALRPAGTTKAWQDVGKTIGPAALKRALDGVNLITAPNAQDEAEAIALIMREVVETPGQTAALVSPDRLLARRVGVRLESWGIRVDDSAGRPFIKTPPGTFLDLVIAAIESDFAPTDVVALLKHPLTRLGFDPFTIRKTARALEIAAFRTDYLGRGLTGIDDALYRARLDVDKERRLHRSVRRIHDEDWDTAHDVVARLKDAYAPLTPSYENGTQTDLKEIVRGHIQAAEALARHEASATEPEDGAPTGEDGAQKPSPLWVGTAGEQGSLFFANLLADTLPDLAITARDYRDLLRSLLIGLNVREQGPVHPRLAIWGLFESRLQQPDVVILGSLNENVWPNSTDPGPWLNRSMRTALSLPSPEEDIGREALDFATLMGADTVYLTRSEKDSGGDPTVPSRWLLRLSALLKGLDAEALLDPEQPWAGWARARDTASTPMPSLNAPEPRPSLELRPRKLSVSNIERWIANPYALFARSILKLEPLDPLGKELGADLRGNIIHQALARFANAYPVGSPSLTSADVITNALIDEAEHVIADYKAHPRIAAFWLPRIKRFARWFGETELIRRQGIDRSIAETSGSLEFKAPHDVFTLTARADRIDLSAEGLVITDYKTGQLPPEKAVKEGYAPQLLLEAAIALYGSNFDRTNEVNQVKGLRFIKASGGLPPGEQRDISVADIDEAAQRALQGLKDLVAHYDNPATPYTALRRQRFDYRFDAYDHLARVAEWSGDDAREGDG